MILLVTEPSTRFILAVENVSKIENEEEFGLNYWVKHPDGSFSEKYISSVESPLDENISLDTHYKLITDNGVQIEHGILLGHQE